MRKSSVIFSVSLGMACVGLFLLSVFTLRKIRKQKLKSFEENTENQTFDFEFFPKFCLPIIPGIAAGLSSLGMKYAMHSLLHFDSSTPSDMLFWLMISISPLGSVL